MTGRRGRRAGIWTARFWARTCSDPGGTPPGDATGLTVGGPEYHGYYLDGDLDDVAVYDHALSPARVLAHYSASRLAGLATTTYAYDAAGRVASHTDADGRTTAYGHDADGNQVSLTDAMGRATASTFDADERLVSTSYSDGTMPVVSTRVVPGTQYMWDLTVQTTHDFYIITITTDVLVCNCPAGYLNGAANPRGPAWDAFSAGVQHNVEDAIERARVGTIRFPGHDGRVYNNSDYVRPPGGSYTEWTDAAAGAKRGSGRVIIDGDPTNPKAIYYWDHVNLPVQIWP